MAGSVKGLIVEIGGDTSGLQKALSKVNSATSSLSRELRGINSLLKLDPTNTELLKQKQDVLNKSIETTQSRLKELKKVKEEADNKMAEGTEINEENYRALQREIINTENKLKQLQLEASKWNKAGQKLDEIGTKLQDIGKKANSVGNSLSTKLTLPIAGLATVGVTYNAQLEKYTKSFETFLGSAEKASEAVQKIKEDASKTPFDTASLIQANQMLISTGENSDDARENILALGEAIIATGGGNDELTRMSANLQQVKNAGKATALDIKQFAYAGIDIYGLLADYTGKSVEEVKDMEVSYEDLTKALKKASQKGGKYYNAMSNASETLTGQTSQLTAEIKDGIGELTKGLMPIAKKVVAQAKELITQFNQLDDTQKENILRIGLMVAAAGPLLKIFGTITSTAGGVAKGIGTISTAIGVMKTGAESSSASANTLAKTLTMLGTNPTGIAIAGITALIATYAAHEVAIKNEKASLGGLRDEVNNQIQTWDDLVKKREEVLSSSLSEIETNEDLFDELQKITDENGNVKSGYEERAKTILNILNGALGTEYKMNGNVIESYKELQLEVDKTIEKKKAEAVLNAYAEEYATAIQEQSKATKTLTDLKQQLGDAAYKIAHGNAKERAEAELLYGAISRKIGEETEQIGKYGKTIQDYESLQKASSEGSSEAIKKAIDDIGVSYDTLKQKSQTTTEEKIRNEVEYVKSLKESLSQAKASNDEYQSQILENQIKTSQEELNNLITSLEKQTSTVKELTPEQIEAWKYASEQSYSKYCEALQNIPPETRKKIEEATGVVSFNGEDLSERFKITANNSNILFKNTLDLNNPVKVELDKTSTVLSNNTTVQEETENLADRAEQAFESQDSTEWGEDMIEGVASGIRQKAQTVLNSAVQEAAKIIHANMHFSRPDKGPLRNYETWMPDMIKGLSKTLKKSSPLLENSALELSRKLKENLDISQMDFGKTNLSSKVIDSTKTVFTTPQIVFNVQELDEAKLQQCFNYINRKFGSQY